MNNQNTVHLARKNWPTRSPPSFAKEKETDLAIRVARWLTGGPRNKILQTCLRKSAASLGDANNRRLATSTHRADAFLKQTGQMHALMIRSSALSSVVVYLERNTGA